MKIVCSNRLARRAFSLLLIVVSLVLFRKNSIAEEFVFGDLRLTVPEGFQVEKVAAAPLLQRPVNMAFDESGALYVTDSSGNNERPVQQLKNPTHRVLRLSDRTGEGCYTHSTVFAENVSFPEGAMWLDGSLYVAAPPVIWKFTDTDGDGVADKREIWFDGGTVTGCANDLHGPYAGPDGWVYWCKGAFAEQRHALSNGRQLVSRASHIFRARPDGSEREMVITGGMDNPVDVVFSRTGERFLSGTFFVKPGAGLRDGVLHAVYGGVWGKEHGVLDGHPRTGELMPVMTHLGPAAACGLELLRGDALGNRGALLCAQFNLRKVSMHQLVSEEATFRTRDEDLLVANDPDFHPTEVLEDADGSVLVADTGGWYKICCPTSKELKPEVLGAIYRVSRKGAVRVRDPRGLNLAWENVAAAELARRLSDSRHEVAARALALLAGRGEVKAAGAVLFAKSDGPAGVEVQARLNALWALIRMKGESARQMIRTALGDPCVEVQEVAAYGAGLWRDAAAVPFLRQLLGSGSPSLARGAAEALGRIGDAGSIGALLEKAPADRVGFHSFAYALYEIGDSARITEAARGRTGASAEVAKTAYAMLALPAAPSIPALPLVSPAATSIDPETRQKQLARLHELLGLLKNGSVERGAELFKSGRALCATCHAVSQSGGILGPDLTKVGAIRTAADLLEAILYPSSSFVRSYEPFQVRLHSGKELYGIVRNETQTELHLATAPATEEHVKRSDIASITEGAMSLMPPGFDGILSPAELADIVAYLLSLR